jgi:hypothetical protein
MADAVDHELVDEHLGGCAHVGFGGHGNFRDGAGARACIEIEFL